MYLLEYLVSSLIIMIMVLIGVAFLTLLERKILGYVQIRKGPNKILFKGILQPISDALKLMSKELFLMKNLNYMIYFLSPCFSFMLMLMLWVIMPNFFNMSISEVSILLFICFLSLGVYMMMLSGWSSNSLYSMLGSIRAISQSISYEVSLILIILSSLFLIESFDMFKMASVQDKIWASIYMWGVMLMFLVSVVAELNRTPFDLAEGESELVSGFNTEYMAGGFVLIFLSEYGMIMLMSYLFMLFYFMVNINSISMGGSVMVMILIILFRGSFPRIRYDKLMMLIWKSFLVVILNYLVFLNFIKWILLILY
uniref:NADH-ubiquinone oxidoreductase chain 1 n=1 Tax=Leptopilina syphax TaxID=2755057 RepID=A0A7D6JWN0_9HYME|nr:NADH dehydrogenase subunit 1 [Leptopilina syphax]